jgi:hypothetical protein
LTREWLGFTYVLRYRYGYTDDYDGLTGIHLRFERLMTRSRYRLPPPGEGAGAAEGAGPRKRKKTKKRKKKRRHRNAKGSRATNTLAAIATTA